MKRLYLFTLVTTILAAGVWLFRPAEPSTIPAGEGLVLPEQWLRPNKQPRTPAEQVRPPDNTFLTFPEWFLVFSPEEQANYFKEHTATTFPFMSHTAQIWQSYKVVNDQIKDHFPSNTGYHFMIWVIGSSASVEYCIKAWYETVIGRLTDTGTPATAEDRFNGAFTQAYVTFIKDRPWYEFDFQKQLKQLWSTVPWTGPQLWRKLERRYILSSELLVKMVYGKLIGIGTKQVYDAALPTTAVVLDGDSLAYVPRYDRFAAEAMLLSRQGHTFTEIAGNNSAILLSLLVPAGHKSEYAGAQTVFVQPLASDKSLQRLVLATPVPLLNKVLNQCSAEGVQVEHVFDF